MSQGSYKNGRIFRHDSKAQSNFPYGKRIRAPIFKVTSQLTDKSQDIGAQPKTAELLTG